jgi:hypothetical protein
MKYFAMFALVISAFGCSKPASVKHDDRFEVPGVCLVGAPVGCEWSIEDKYNKLFWCKQKTGDHLVVACLRLGDAAERTDKSRSAKVEEYFDYVRKMCAIAGHGISIVDEEHPNKLSEQVRCCVTTKDQGGTNGYYRTLLAFGKKETVILQAASQSREEAAATLDAIEKTFELLDR